MQLKLYPTLDPHYIVIDSALAPKLYARYSYKDREVGGTSLEYILINEEAVEVLRECTGQKTLNDICSNIANKHGTNPQTVLADISKFINLACKQKYISLSTKPKQRDNIYVGSNTFSTPISAFIEITKRCPLKCLHCYNRSGSQQNSEMTLEELKKTADILSHSGVQKLMITGGEPFARDDLLHFINYIAPRFVGIMIGTNAYLIQDADIQQLAKINKHYGNLAIQISLDGMQKSHDAIRGINGSFDKASATFKALAQENIPIIAAMTVNKFNFDDIEPLTKHVLSLGARQLSISITVHQGRAKDNGLAHDDYYTKTINEIKRMRQLYGNKGMYIFLDEETTRLYAEDSKMPYCGAGIDLIAIRENGNVSPCVSYNFTYGNILKDNPEIIFSKENALFFEQLPRPSQELCGNCTLLERNCKQCNARALDSDIGNCRWQRLFNRAIEGRTHELL